MKNLLSKAKQILVLFLAITLFSCEEDDAVMAGVTSGFTYTFNADTGTVTFINISENTTKYQWDFGDGTTSTLINPIKVYSSGTYTVQLVSSNVAGASDMFEDTITIVIPEIATLPITFDGVYTKYEPETFGGVSFTVVDNPDASGANSNASKVGKITNIGASYEGFYFDLGAPVDLATLKSIEILFWSNTPIDVLIKLEEGTGTPVETAASHSGSGWEAMYFTFNSSSSYNRFTMFVDGPGTTAGDFYIDNISQIATEDIPCTETNLELPIDFDCDGIDYTSKIVGNVSFEVIDNPELSGINSGESKVGKIVNAGANWENAFFNLDTPVSFPADKGIRFKLYSDQALPVKIKFEDGTEDPVEADANHGGSGWEELTFTINSNGSYNDMVIFVDGPGTASGTFYIDDIEQFSGDLGDPCQAETMQSLSGADLNLTFMLDPTSSIVEDGADFQWVDNPDFNNDMNKSCKVGKITKLGNNPWDNNQIDLDTKLDFNSNEGLKIKVWSSRANTEVRIKLEEIGNAGNNVEQFKTTTLTNAWEELTFPFTSGDSNKFNKVVIFLDLNANNTDTYYFDDLMLYGSGGGGGGAFDDGLLTNGDFENGATAWIGNALNVTTEGGNSFNFADVTAVGNPYDVNLSQVVTIVPDKNYVLSFDASSDRSRTLIAGIGLNHDPWDNTVQTVDLTTTTQTFTLELSSAGFGDDNSRVLFDMGAAIGVVVIDNVSLFCTDCDGGTGGGGGTDGNLATNSDFETGDETGWLLFQNGGTAVLDNTVSNNGGSWSGKLSTNGASNPAFKQERIGAGTVAAGDVVQVKFDHIGEVGGEGGVFNIILFGEGAGGAVPFTHIFNPAPVLSGSWSTFTGTFTIPAGTDVSEGISFLIETVCGGAPGCSVSANIDNVSVTLNP